MQINIHQGIEHRVGTALPTGPMDRMDKTKNLSVLLRAPAFLTGGALARSKSVAKCQGMRRRGSDDREVENKEKKAYLVP